MNLYRAKYESSGNETFTNCCLPNDEHDEKFSHLIKHHTGHEKIEKSTTAVKKK